MDIAAAYLVFDGPLGRDGRDRRHLQFCSAWQGMAPRSAVFNFIAIDEGSE